MKGKRYWALAVLLGLAVAVTTPLTAMADEAQSARWLTALSAQGEEPSQQVEHDVLEGQEAGWAKPIPITFIVDYTYVSDYVFRGVNRSEFDGEDGERCNSQLTVGAAWDTGVVGTFGFTIWWEWYSGQLEMDPASHTRLQEVDYTIYWAYDLREIVPSLPVIFETGWIAYTFNNATGDCYYTHEWYWGFYLNDGELLGLDQGILNPYIVWYLDLDDYRGSFIEMGMSHDFILADLGMDNTPILKDITVTPSAVMGIDHRYFYPTNESNNKATRLANVLYGLAVAYDLSGALNLPERYGNITITGFMNYSHAIANKLRHDLISDEFFGGVSATYEW